MAFNYEAAKAMYGAQKAKQMEKQANAAAPGPAPGPPAPVVPAPSSSGGQDVSGFSSFAEWQKANIAAGGRGLASAYQASGGVLKPGEVDQYNVGGNSGGGAPNNQANMTPEQRVDWAMQNIDSLDAHGTPEQARVQWTTWQRSFDPTCPSATPYQAEDGTGCVEKPDNSNNPNAGGQQNLPGFKGWGSQGGFGGTPGSSGGKGGSNLGGSSGSSSTYGGAPAFNYKDWTPPSWQDAISDPGYQFALNQGLDAMSSSAAARGTQFTGGTMQDLIDYGQSAAAQQYQSVFDRSAQEYGINRDTARDKFAPQYGSWQTQYGGDLSKWTTKYGGNLSKYMQRENNIYGVLNQPMPQYPGYY